ncbi:MAG: hypothetical protein AUH85_06170 [Chloroflexi bacterium 13_1_40CM_4_68_4]|nr:MAG: hypothetical protein AUH85_06170 [Chloroflexi bacterium 13_1_40CM_4_68_4]
MTLNAYIAAVAAAGSIVFATQVARLDAMRIDPLIAILLLGLAALAQRMPVYLFRSSAVSVSYVATIAAYVLYGAPFGLLVNLSSAVVNSFTPRPKPFRKIVFNTASLTLAAGLAGATYELLGEVPPTQIVATIAAVAVSGLVYFFASTALTAGVIALSTGGAALQIWRENYAWMTVNYVATAILGAMLALAYRSLGIFGAGSFVLPLAVAWYSFKLYMSSSTELRQRNRELQRVNETLRGATSRLEEAYLSGVRALVEAIESKDETRRGHAAAAAVLAASIARRLRLSPEEALRTEIGALVHDIGRVGVSERILLKPDWLTDEERHEVQAHPTIGANLLGRVPALAELVPIVVAHHERFDGTGYPAGLRGEAIPIGARIVAVADAYQAMISPRPYRPAFEPSRARDEIARGAGSQFDPAVVEALLAVVGAARVGESAPASAQA